MKVLTRLIFELFPNSLRIMEPATLEFYAAEMLFLLLRFLLLVPNLTLDFVAEIEEK